MFGTKNKTTYEKYFTKHINFGCGYRIGLSASSPSQGKNGFIALNIFSTFYQFHGSLMLL